jgi:hypothetical protein
LIAVAVQVPVGGERREPVMHLIFIVFTTGKDANEAPASVREMGCVGGLMPAASANVFGIVPTVPSE